jgi:hypothetical protein
MSKKSKDSSDILREKILEYKHAPFTRLDLAMTIELAMTEEERQNLIAMIDHMQKEEKPEHIMFNIIHDLQGFKRRHIQGLVCFVPRSASYAKKVKA